ncbi:MAG: hypothetical protein LBI64_00785 [Coriobacteriales bacterium]|nr:hypothetical protein [Coriobacteriales bacterium]
MENVENTVVAGVSLWKTHQMPVFGQLDILLKPGIVTESNLLRQQNSALYQLFCICSLKRESSFRTRDDLSVSLVGEPAKRHLIHMGYRFFHRLFCVFHVVVSFSSHIS